ncbi:hypothetical protein SH580_05905 [Coraliomargarita algicola]|uniref:Uncharacterized protein n=1 Tax=Coraliomargarita algicola TaxID=3092156 RepID=A0ABZ0RQI2_9BACT|nr:hypothetical protein [Coraliomargarita sp. J2-16]WPJ97240.1 hypothetical protein SH580_05905 [Coraliomargarita sp. J2-16]
MIPPEIASQANFHSNDSTTVVAGVFELPASELAMEVWLQGDQAKPVFFKEWLTACFDRTLDFDVWEPAGACFEWIFTGPSGKVTLSLASDELVLQQSFHDSFYLNSPELIFDQDFEVPRKLWFQNEMSEFDGNTGINVHPEVKWAARRCALPSVVKSVRLTLAHNMEMAVWVNGEKMISQVCLQDLHHHQLRVSDISAKCSGRLLQPELRTVSVRVESDQLRQTMIGFGGTATPMAYAELSDAGKERFWQFVESYNLRIQRENPIAGELRETMDNWDDPDSAIPHYYGDNFPNGNISDFELNKEFLQRGGEVWFEYWSFPKWMVHDGETYIDEKGKERHGPLKVEAYAESIVNYCRLAQQKAGRPPHIVGIQNENSHPKVTYHAMVATLRQALDDAGFTDVKIHMSDANMLSGDSEWGKLYADGVTRAQTFTEKPETWEKIDYAATHMYDFQQYFDDPDHFDAPMRELHALYGDRPFLSTELCVNSPRYQMKSYRLALLMGQLIHKNLTLLDAAALLYCWTLLNVEQPSYAWTRSLLTIDRENGFDAIPSSHQLRVLGAWSRRIRKGMTRVELVHDHADLQMSVFIDGKGGQTVVALNRGLVAIRLDLEGIDLAKTKWVEEVSPYAANTVVRACQDPDAVYVIAPGSILTLTNVPLGQV